MVSRFVTKEERTEPYKKAVCALQELIEAESLGKAERAVAEALSEPLKRLYVKQRGVKPTSGRRVPSRLFGRRQECEPCRVWQDHPTLWIKKGHPYSYVSQPYCLSLKDMQEIVTYCAAHGLDAAIDAAGSWHFPGVTLLVEIKKRPGAKGLNRFKIGE